MKTAKKNTGMFNPNKSISPSEIKSVRRDIKSIGTRKRLEFSNWLDSLKTFELMQQEKYYIAKVSAKSFGALLDYHAALNNIFDFMYSFYTSKPSEKFPMGERYFWSHALDKLYVDIFTKKTEKDMIKIRLQLVALDRQLILDKERFGLGLSGIVSNDIDGEQADKYVMRFDNANKSKAKREIPATENEDDNGRAHEMG